MLIKKEKRKKEERMRKVSYSEVKVQAEEIIDFLETEEGLDLVVGTVILSREKAAELSSKEPNFSLLFIADPLLEGEAPPIPPLADVAKRLGYSISYREFNGRQVGLSNLSTKEIVLSSKDIVVFFHELAHCIHNSFECLERGQHPDQEVVAEFTAAILTRVYKYPWSIVSYNYIRMCATKLHCSPAFACVACWEKVDKILRFIFQ